jgi:hypothetical protein
MNYLFQLTMEALILREPWKNLFTEDERRIAKKRLSDCGYFIRMDN